jgi:hypothetical protein
MSNQQLKCKCGCTKFYQLNGYVLTSNPPIRVDVWKCIECGEKNEIQFMQKNNVSSGEEVFWENSV